MVGQDKLHELVKNIEHVLVGKREAIVDTINHGLGDRFDVTRPASNNAHLTPGEGEVAIPNPVVLRVRADVPLWRGRGQEIRAGSRCGAIAKSSDLARFGVYDASRRPRLASTKRR